MRTRTFQVSGPKSAKIPQYLKDLAWEIGIECQVESDASWLSIGENVSVRLRGDQSKIDQFCNHVILSVEEYSKE